jgi:hypothetical protein
VSSSTAMGRVLAWPSPNCTSPHGSLLDSNMPILLDRDISIGAYGAMESHGHVRDESSSPTARPQTKVESELSLKILRVKLMQAMSATLQAVDLTAKTWVSGHVEIALYAAREYSKLGSLSGSILAICRELREVEEADQKRRPPIEPIETIAVALSSICRHANDASLQFVTLQDAGRHEWLRDIVPMGECITRSLRLCVVAFANREIAHAISAIREIDDSWYEKSIATDLVRMMENVHIVALQLNCVAVYEI